MILFDEIAETLDHAAIPYALIGAGALAVYGVVRSTFDLDVLTTDPRVLDELFWSALRPEATMDVHRGDDDDPLAAAVRFTAPGERDVDLMVGRPGWMDGVLARRATVPLPGRDVAVVTAGDLILLKLYAGGLQDRWDIEQLLAAVPAGSVRADVESRLSDLPAYSGTLWHQIFGLTGNTTRPE
jgi:hypothetical protein